MRTAVEISMYPLGLDYRPKIQAFIDRLHSHAGLVILTNALSTQIWGELGTVMTAITQEIEQAAAAGTQLVYVFKVLPGLAPPTGAALA